MKKKYYSKAIIISAALTMAFTGCGLPSKVADLEEETEAVVESTEATEQDQESESDKTQEPAEQSSEWEDPYDAFLAGDGKISVQYYMDNVYGIDGNTTYADDVIGAIPADKDYTLKEFHDVLYDNAQDEAATGSMGYAFLDCGADGNKELAIKVQGNFVEPESYMTFVIKEIDNKLQIVYAFAEWSRSETSLYEYGTLYGYGSGGATVHGWDEAYINADGKFMEGYYEEEQSELEDFSRYHDHDDYDISGLDGNIIVYTLRIGDDEYYSYDVYNNDYEKIEIPNLYTDSPYQKVMDSHKDIRFISMDEMDKIAADRMEEIGATGKAGSGAYLEYKDIDFDKEYVHDISADKYQIFASIQEELAVYEALSEEFDDSDIDNMPQQVANYTSYRWYRLWDNELNDLWDRITSEISEDKKQTLVDEQRDWIKRKEANVKEAGSDFEGGTMQPLLENCAAERFTRKRCYELAVILAELKGEDFQVPGAVAESYADVDHTLEEMFEKFEGQWVFDQERGACTGIERSETCEYAPEGSKWTVWQTGGDTISDLDVYSFTDYAIIFKVPHDSYDSYYKLQFNWDNEVELLYGHSLEELYPE